MVYSQEEMRELRDSGLADDTYFDKIAAREAHEQEQERLTRSRLRRISARLHKLAHEAWREDDSHTMQTCLEAAAVLDAEAPPTPRMARRYEDEMLTRYHYEHRDPRADWLY